MTTTTIAFPPLLLLLALLIVGAVLLIKGGRKVRLAVGLGVLAVIAAAVTFSLVSVAVRTRSTHVTDVLTRGIGPNDTSFERLAETAEVYYVYGQPGNAYAVPPEPLPELWKSAADLEISADLHPSAAAAADALAVEVLKMKDAHYPDVGIRRVQLWSPPELGSQVVSRILSRLQRKVPDWMVMLQAERPTTPIESEDEFAASLWLEAPTPLTKQRAAWDTNREEKGGMLQMRLSFKDGSTHRTIVCSTAFADKPWLENMSEFITARPQYKWVVGWSGNVTDRAQASRQAIRAAAIQILPEVEARLLPGTQAQLGPQGGAGAQRLLATIEKQIAEGGDVRDRFVQTLTVKSGGRVVREAVLVQSPNVVTRAVQAWLTQAQQRRQVARLQTESWIGLVASAAGMCLLVCVVGLVLNAITKGYYRGRLLLAGGLLLILGVVVLLRIRAMPANVIVSGPASIDNVIVDTDVPVEYGYIYR
ncbi:MAG TPA: hypothetical protein PL151_01825 [Phycisphaerae bacterium]|mgnify:CR=1 FL=1|nr:hypothetical protein [Phycisphaerae bacterium]HQE26471.1 hypothetical protein [Phycisphaerae bacterium]